MSIYLDYLAEIDSRKTQGLAPKPIDDGVLLGEIITIIQDAASEHRADALKFFIYNTLPGTLRPSHSEYTAKCVWLS